jgi:hypothetical protein
MQSTDLGRALVLLYAVLAAACARAAPARVAPLAAPATLAFSPPAAPACALTAAETVWLPGAEQLLSYCQTVLELRDADGLVRAQRMMSLPAGVRAAVVSPDGTHVALDVSGHLEVRELPSLNLRWAADVRPYSMAFSADGRQLVLPDYTTDNAFSVADGRRVAASAPSLAKRWQNSPALNADGTLAFEIEPSKVTLWDPIKDVALRSFESPKGSYGQPDWVGPYLGFGGSAEHVLVDARDPNRRFSLVGISSLRRAALSRDGARLRCVERGDVLEWRLGEAKPAVLASDSPDRVWLGPAGLRVESSVVALTSWRQMPSGERVPRRYWARPDWLEIATTGDIVSLDSSQHRLLFLAAGASEPADIAFPQEEPPKLLAFEPGGRRFVTAAAGKLRVYQQPKLKLQQTIELPFAPTAVAWRAAPSELLVIDTDRLHSVALGSGKVTPLSDFEGVLRVAVSDSGKDVAVVALRAGKPQLTLLGAAGMKYPDLPEMPRDMRFSPDGKALWLLGQDSLFTLRLGPATTAAESARRRPIKADGCQTRLAPTGEVYCPSGRLRLAAESGELVPEPEPVAIQLAWPARGLTLTSDVHRQAPVVVSLPLGTSVAQQLPENPPKPATMPELALVSGDVQAWALNADRSSVAVLDGNKTVNTFSTHGGLLARLTESAGSLISSEDASALAIISTDARRLTLWDTHTWRPRVEVPVVEHISQLAVSKDGARVAVLTDQGTLEVVFADRSLRRYELRRDIAARGLAFDPSGQYLGLGGLPLRIVRLADGAVLYGYTASVETKDPTALAWVSESGEVAGDLRVLRAFPVRSPGHPGAFLGAAAFTQRQAPHLLETFFEPAPVRGR